MKKQSLAIVIIAMLCILVISSMSSFTSENEPVHTEASTSGECIVVGFSQLGAESDWRSAHTESIQSTFTVENGYKLLLEDGQQKQANQITAIRTFIQQEIGRASCRERV